MENRKIALITGGSRGLGKEMALALARKNIDSIITYVTKKEEATGVVAEINKSGKKAAALDFDVSDIASYDKFIKEVLQTLKQNWSAEKLDFLLNNAGIGATVPFPQVTEEMFDRFLNIHFKGVFFLTQKLLPHMNDNGAIVNISSGTTRFSNPGYSVYASMKGAVEVLTRYLAKELGSRKIRVNVVAPGPVETDFNNAGIRNAPPERKKAMMANTALGRLGKPEDIGNIVAFLCSEESTWINGQRIEASGGINL